MGQTEHIKATGSEYDWISIFKSIQPDNYSNYNKFLDIEEISPIADKREVFEDFFK